MAGGDVLHYGFSLGKLTVVLSDIVFRHHIIIEGFQLGQRQPLRGVLDNPDEFFSSVFFVHGNLKMVFHKCFHGFVAGEAEVVVNLGGGAVAVFGTLPEETLVVAEEGGGLHLTLVLEDGVALLT